MFEKLKNLFNLKALLDGVILSRVASKAIQYGTAAAIALLASPKVVPYLLTLKPYLDDAGLQPEKVATVAVAALVGAVINFVKRKASL